MNYYHFQGKNFINNATGGITIAWKLEKNHQGKKIQFSVAQCSYKDQYCKKTGRDMALKQWNKGNTLSFVIKGSDDRYRINNHLQNIAISIYSLQNPKGL